MTQELLDLLRNPEIDFSSRRIAGEKQSVLSDREHLHAQHRRPMSNEEIKDKNGDFESGLLRRLEPPSIDRFYLQSALRLAERRRGFCSPNPSVGALLVKDNKIVATGIHWESGQAHAEAVALKAAGPLAKGAVLYSSLEPCCHFPKKTPPCTDAIIQAGVTRVVYGAQDVNPEVRGKSEAILKAANILSVRIALPEIDEFYRSYRFWWKHQMPFVTAKLAISLEGKLAGPQGQRIQLTGQTAAKFTHESRKRSDALLTTVNTIQKDDPGLNVRLDQETHSKPLYILDTQLRMPPTANIFSTSDNITIFHGDMEHPACTQMKIRRDQLTQQGAHCVAVPMSESGLDLLSVMQFIGQTQGRQDVWVETGSRCFASLQQAKLLHRVLIYIAPVFLGALAKSAFIGETIGRHLRFRRWQMLEPDVVCEFLDESACV